MGRKAGTASSKKKQPKADDKNHACDRHADAVTAQMNNLYADWCRCNNRPRLDPYAFKCTASVGGAQYLADLRGEG